MHSCASHPATLHPELNSSYVCLDCLPKARRAEVVELPRGMGATRRLADLGIFVGAILRVERTAPLGGPVLVDVQGSLVALGRQLARRVLVRILP